jgi:hypothetical protein
MGWPQAFEVLNEVLWQLSHAELTRFWGALHRARSTRAVLFRQQVLLMGHLQVTEQYIEHAAHPAVLMAVLEVLVWEKQLSRAKASALQDRILQGVDAHGCWQGNIWDGVERVGVLPPDVERLASIGA